MLMAFDQGTAILWLIGLRTSTPTQPAAAWFRMLRPAQNEDGAQL